MASSLWFCKIMQVNLKKKETRLLDFCVFDPFRMTKPFYTTGSSQLHGGIRKVGRWTTLASTIFLLTCRSVVLQVQVVPRSSLQLPPEGLKGSKPGCWQVSSEGRYRNSRGRISHGCLENSGYCAVCIRGSLFLVHRLIAHAFLGPPTSEASWQVNHIDGNCSNNRKDNLEWATRSENVRHSYATNPSRGNGGSKRARPVMIRPLGACSWTRFSSIKLAAQELGRHSETVRYRCHRNMQVDGYEYKFAPVQRVDIPGEEWRPMIDPRSGRHVSGRMVSSEGRFKSKTGHISFGCSRPDGYLVTRIVMGSQSQYRDELVHRLVAASFLGLPPSPERSQINHKDGNKRNNAVENLEYVTPAQNIAHRFACQKGRNPLSKVVSSRMYGTTEEWTRHPSMASAEETLGLHQSSVSRCARGLWKQTGGYEFRFAEPEPCVAETLPGEVWRDVDLDAHLKDRKRRKRRQRQRRHMKVQWGWAAPLTRFVCGYDDMIWFWFTSSLILVLACFSFLNCWSCRWGGIWKHLHSLCFTRSRVPGHRTTLLDPPQSWKSSQLSETVCQMATVDLDDI